MDVFVGLWGQIMRKKEAPMAHNKVWHTERIYLCFFLVLGSIWPFCPYMFKFRLPGVSQETHFLTDYLCHLKICMCSACFSVVGWINLKYLLILPIQQILTVSQLCRDPEIILKSLNLTQRRGKASRSTEESVTSITSARPLSGDPQCPIRRSPIGKSLTAFLG